MVVSLKTDISNKMIFKFSVKILFIAAEIFLAFYSMAFSDSLLVKFLFFAVTALIVAFGITKLISRLLPLEKDYMGMQENQEETKTEE